jgi:hypothetical protein
MEWYRKVNPVTPRNLFQIQQAGVLFDAKLVKLVELISDAARFGGFFLCPTALDAQFAQTLLKPEWGGVLHHQ